MEEWQWYFAQGGQQQGPVATAALRDMLSSGRLRPFDLVWHKGMPQWAPADSIEGLVPAGLPIGYAGLPQPGSSDIGQSAGTRWLLPVGRSGWAIAAGYLGLFSLLVLPAPVALIVSIVALRDIKKHPERHGKGRAIFGLIMGGIGTVLAIVIFVARVFDAGE